MKVSELVEEIVIAAEDKFAVSAHPNDCINVGMYPNGEEWQVWLERPTQRQLDHGVVLSENINSVRTWETDCSFLVRTPTLVDALIELRDWVYDAVCWEDGQIEY